MVAARMDGWKSKTARWGTASSGTASRELSLAGRMKPRAVEIQRIARRTKRLRTEKADMQWLKRIGQALNRICADCVVDLNQNADFKMH